MGAMAIIAGTVVVVATGTVVVVVTPAVPPVATPETTFCSREGSWGKEKGEEKVMERKLSNNKTADLSATMVSSGSLVILSNISLQLLIIYSKNGRY